MKRLLLIVLQIAIICIPSLTVSANTVETSDEKAYQLYQLGLFSGVSSVYYTPNLEGETDREQAMVMLSTMFGWKEMEPKHCIFLDVSDWAKSAVATAFERGVTSGIGYGQFGGNNKITERQLVSWITRELGYDNPYNNIFIARDIGLIDYTTADRINKDIVSKTEKALVRGDLVKYFYATLGMMPRGDDMTIVEQLVVSKPWLKAKVQEYGLIGNIELPLNVKDVMAIDYHEIAVTYTGTINKERVLQKNNYTISNNTVVEATLENNTVVLLLENKLAKMEDVLVTVKKDVGIPAEIHLLISNVIDETRPIVTGIEIIHKYAIEITFSESIRIDYKPTVSVNYNTISNFVAKPVGRKIRVTLGSPLSNNTINIVRVSGARDHGNLIMEEYVWIFAYNENK